MIMTNRSPRRFCFTFIVNLGRQFFAIAKNTDKSKKCLSVGSSGMLYVCRRHLLSICVLAPAYTTIDMPDVTTGNGKFSGLIGFFGNLYF